MSGWGDDDDGGGNDGWGDEDAAPEVDDGWDDGWDDGGGAVEGDTPAGGDGDGGWGDRGASSVSTWGTGEGGSQGTSEDASTSWNGDGDDGWGDSEGDSTPGWGVAARSPIEVVPSPEEVEAAVSAIANSMSAWGTDPKSARKGTSVTAESVDAAEVPADDGWGSQGVDESGWGGPTDEDDNDDAEKRALPSGAARAPPFPPRVWDYPIQRGPL